MKLHENEIEISRALVEELLKNQCPHYLNEDLSELSVSGTENVMFSLGADKLVRLPRIKGAVSSLEKEARWLPILEKNLKIPIPKVFLRGKVLLFILSHGLLFQS